MTAARVSIKPSGVSRGRDLGLDGVRAIAVAAVIAFHLAPAKVPGGFIGVDLFFVLSGFVITRVVIQRWRATSRVSLGRFWTRRIRRLLPALVLVLAANAVTTLVVGSDQRYRLLGDTAAGLAFISNWTQIKWYRGYFAAADQPSSLQHLWSLAIEMQFYLIWPLMLAGLFAIAARLTDRSMRALLLTVCLAGVAASLAVMASVYSSSGVTRAYYGTDSHVSGLFAGAAIAIASFASSGRAPRRLWWKDCLVVTGLIGLGLSLFLVTDRSGWLFNGGYAAVLVACVAVVAGATSESAIGASVLSGRAMVWIGQRSYGIYLWHWPVIVLTQPDAADAWWLKGVTWSLQLVIIVIASALSYRFVETPIREQGFKRVFRTVGGTGRHSQRRATALPGVSLALAAGVMATALVMTLGDVAPPGIEIDQSRPRPTLSLPSLTTSPTREATRSVASAPAASPTPQPFARPVTVSFFGDSQGMTLLLNKPAGLEAAVTLSDSTIEGCGVLVGTITSATGFERNLTSDCGDWLDTWRTRAASIKPQVAVVEIGAWDVFDLTLNGRVLPFGTPAWDQNFQKQLQQGVQALRQAGAQVALLGVPCYRPIAAGGLPQLPERGDDSRTRRLNVLLAQVAAADPAHVFVVDPPAQFCTDPAIATNTAYRWDGTHYYIPGAALMFESIIPQLLRIPKPG